MTRLQNWIREGMMRSSWPLRACAGSDSTDRISAAIPIDQCTRPRGRGIIALEIRSDDNSSREAARLVHDRTAGAAPDAERAVVAAVGGGVVAARRRGGRARGDFELYAVGSASHDGSASSRPGLMTAPVYDPSAVGSRSQIGLRRRRRVPSSTASVARTGRSREAIERAVVLRAHVPPRATCYMRTVCPACYA